MVLDLDVLVGASTKRPRMRTEMGAFLSAKSFLHEGDDTWQPHIVNYYYGTDFPAPTPSRPGKNVGWTDWTHGQ